MQVNIHKKSNKLPTLAEVPEGCAFMYEGKTYIFTGFVGTFANALELTEYGLIPMAWEIVRVKHWHVQPMKITSIDLVPHTGCDCE